MSHSIISLFGGNLINVCDLLRSNRCMKNSKNLIIKKTDMYGEKQKDTKCKNSCMLARKVSFNSVSRNASYM